MRIKSAKKQKSPEEMKAAILKKWAELREKVIEYNEAKNGNG